MLSNYYTLNLKAVRYLCKNSYKLKILLGTDNIYI